MRAVLVFPPQASPTYAPLGVATLASHVAETAPGCRLEVRDVNLAAWEAAASTASGGTELLRFLRGQEGDFFDRAAYAARQAVWREVEGILSRWGDRINRYLAVGEADAELLGLLDGLTSEILETDPELVGFSLLSLGQLAWALAMARRIRQRAPAFRLHRAAGTSSVGGPRIILGGAACAAFRAEDVLQACSFVNGVVVGEGEAGLSTLCRCAADRDVPGLVYRASSGISRNRVAQTSSLKHAVVPDFGGLPLGRYLNPTPVLPVLYSRGCKWRRCRFCAHNFSFAGYRTKAADRCVDELEALAARHGAQHFYFADLYVDAPDLEDLADRLLARRLNIHFHVLGRPTEDYSRERLEKMSAAGCRWISWGVESGSQRLLDVAGKGTRVETVTQVLGDAQDAGISNLMMMIFGLPASTDADLADTFRFLEGAYERVDAMTASSFVLFEDTPFARGAERFGLTVRAREEEVRVDGVPIHSKRLLFAERSADGSLRPPRGPVEVGEWHRRRRWFGEVPFLEGLPCEHYLLFVSPRTTGTQVPPAEPPTRKAA